MSPILVALDLFVAFVVILHHTKSVELYSGDNTNKAPIATNEEIHADEDEEWNYEPRVWQPEFDEKNLKEDYQLEFSSTYEELQQQQQQQQVEKSELLKSKQREENFREKNYFFESARRDESEPVDGIKESFISGKQNKETKDKKECDQFQVDFPETIVCNKRRCDKLDFEWPKYDNQIVHIETTKHGMRFYRAEYAMVTPPPPPPPPSAPRFKEQQQQQQREEIDARSREVVRSTSMNKRQQYQEPQFQQYQQKYKPTREQIEIITNEDRIKPVKFDLFELFKPKTTTTTTTTTSTPVPPVTNALPSTTEPAENATNTEQETTTSTTEPSSEPNGDSSQEVSKSNSIIDEQNLDKNKTRLITSYRLDTRHKMQTMIGFGGALSDSTCRNIKSLSPDMAKSLMEDYFGPRGLRYNIVRMTMGSSDFSTTPYTNNDKPGTSDSSSGGHSTLSKVKLAQPNETELEARARWWFMNNNNSSSDTSRPTLDKIRQTNSAVNGSRMMLDEDDDVEMKKFHLVDEDFEFKLPLARQAIATSRQQLKFFSSLWSPPIWMKNNSHIVHGWLKGDVYGPYYKALADYMIKWLEAYRKNGIEFWATTGLNEPITGVKPFIFHNSLGITREDYIIFIKLYLGPMLRQRNFYNIKLIIMDDNKGYAPFWARAVLEDPEASKYVAGVGIHWYMNDEYENLNYLSKEFPDKFMLSTEACNGYLPFQVHALPGNWDRGVAYMYDIIKTIQKNSAGWVDWNMVLDLDGGPSWAKNNLDAAIIVNPERDEYYKSPMFYAMGHFSRFVEPNSTRLDHRLANARYNQPLEVVSFYTPRDYIVIVALNTNKHPIPFRIIVDKRLVRIVQLRANSYNTIIFKWKRSTS